MIVYITLGVIVASLFIYYKYQRDLVERKQERKAAAMQPPKRIYQPSRSNFSPGIKGEHFVLVSQSGSDNTRSFKFESPRKIAENKPGLGVISPFKDSNFSPLNLQEDLFKPKKTVEKKTVVPEIILPETQPLNQKPPVKEFKSPLPIKISMDTPVKVHVDTPRPFVEPKSYAPVTPSPLVRVTNNEELELDSGEIADISSEVKVEKKKLKPTSTPIRKKKSTGRAAKKAPASVRKGITSVRSRVGLFESLNDTNNIEEVEKPVEKSIEKPVELPNKSKRKFEEDEFPENLLPEDGFSWQLGDNVRLKKKIKTKQAEETIVKKRIEFFKNLGFDITKSTELSQEQAPGRLPISSTEDGTKKRLRKELDEDELDEITINRLKKESPAKKVEFAVPEKKVDFAIPENKENAAVETSKPFTLAKDTTAEKAVEPSEKIEMKSEQKQESSKPPLFSLPKSDAKDKSFTFGKPADSNTLFTFGKTDKEVSKAEEKKVTPVGLFGKTEESAKPSSFNKPAEAKDGEKPAFTFGKPAEAKAQSEIKAPEVKEPHPAPAFSFKAPEPKSDTGLFKAPEPKTETAGSALSFGNSSESKTDTKPAFSFGKPADSTTTAPTLSFGKPAETKEAAPGFSFGKPAETKETAPAPFSFGKPAETKETAPAPFTFGKPAETKEAAPAPFTFGKPAETKEAAPAPFSFGKPAETKAPETKDSTGAANAVPAFGVPSATTNSFTFGQPNNNQTGAPTFGQPPAATATSGSTFSFGQPTTNNNPSTTPAFGSTAPTFGKPNDSANTTTPSFGGFGQSNTSSTAPTFGQPTTTFGSNNSTTTFGDNKTNPPSFGVATGTTNPAPTFGSNATNPPTFGQPTTTSTPSFGQPNTGNTTFGATPNPPAFGANNTFGQSNNTFGNSAPAFGTSNTTFGAQNNPTGFASSQPAQTGFGTQNTFGSNTSTTATAPAFGSTFGNNSAPSFGQPAAPTFGQPAATPAFGQTNTTAPSFGQPAANQPSTGFNFQAPTGAPSFNFGAAAPPSFQFGAGNAQPSQIPPSNMNRPMATPKFRRGPKGGRR
ncbi:hypothetical protein HK103_003077 [Boothiomyces macroporosus]|uniref:Uncharacterized protein n=1 Tax=Boothiomyces macroporosus TaxID=261099 RepID=A0AAD5UCA2_9FUNG|nr:hypothetical protein HK103_003077 [Boothiomyces macroporosus]